MPDPLRPATSRRKILAGLAVSAAVAGTGSSHRCTSPPAVTAANQQEAVTLPPLEVIALTRLSFGIAQADLEAFQALPGASSREKFKAYLEQQLQPASLRNEACEQRLAPLQSLQKPIEQLWREYYRGAPATDKKYEVIYQPTNETKFATLVRAVYSKQQLQEVLADFWHNHFNISPDRDERIAPIFPNWDAEVIRKHLLGNFRQMLGAVAAHPAMLYYLDNASSNRAGPNENWARELFELHTLGAENYLGVKRQNQVPGFAQGQPVGYVDDDVYEATRAFTGWRVNDTKDEPGLNDSGSFRYHAPGHDRFQKTVLGRYLPPDQAPMQDGYAVLDALAEHPGTARHISRKLARRLIGDNPPQTLVDAAAKVFLTQRKAPDQLKQVIRTIVLSDAFSQTWGEKIKRPFEVYVSMLRATNAQLNPAKANDILGQLWQLGQPLFGRIPPDGYPDRREDWSSTSSVLERWRWAQGVAGDWWTEAIKSDVVKQTPTRQPKQVLEVWVKRILARPLATPTQTAITAYMHEIRGGNLDNPLSEDDAKWFIPLTVAAVLSSPDFQWR
jgi:uncharacterized protein (DUF1800 family)